MLGVDRYLKSASQLVYYVYVTVAMAVCLCVSSWQIQGSLEGATKRRDHHWMVVYVRVYVIVVHYDFCVDRWMFASTAKMQ